MQNVKPHHLQDILDQLEGQFAELSLFSKKPFEKKEPDLMVDGDFSCSFCRLRTHCAAKSPQKSHRHTQCSFYAKRVI